MHTANRPIDTKRDEYRKYLERTGVLQAVSRVLTKLYEEPEKPTDALRFVINSFGESSESNKDLEKELTEEREKNARLIEELNDIKAQFAAYKKAEADAAKDEDAMLAENEEITSATSTTVPESTAPPVSESAPVVSATEPVAPAALTESPAEAESAPITAETIMQGVETVTPAGSVETATSTPIPATPAPTPNPAPDNAEPSDVTMTEVSSNSV